MKATFVPGLPGTGSLPVHLHTGKPTPWSEGYVIRVQPDSGKEWIGNLQAGYGYATKIIEWSTANAIIVIAHGASYFVRPDHPDEWTYIDNSGIDCSIAPHGKIALLATYNDIIAISMNGSELWRHSVAVDGVEITRIVDGLIFGQACMDPPDMWVPFILDLNKGFEVQISDD